MNIPPVTYLCIAFILSGIMAFLTIVLPAIIRSGQISRSEARQPGPIEGLEIDLARRNREQAGMLEEWEERNP